MNLSQMAILKAFSYIPVTRTPNVNPTLYSRSYKPLTISSLTEKQLANVRENISAQSPFRRNNVRNLLIFDIIQETQITIRDLVLVKLEDIDFEKGIILLRAKKETSGRCKRAMHAKHINVSSELFVRVDYYLRYWRVKVGTEHPSILRLKQYSGLPLFTSSHKKAISPSLVSKTINEAVGRI